MLLIASVSGDESRFPSRAAPIQRRFSWDTPEDTILRKLEWYRRGGESSERQWRDVVGIVNAQSARLDRAYMRDWAVKLSVSDLLERALGDSGP
ncbi:MAG TPA: hypothetical protein VLN49_23990 [Gemmatimonadaceae bacterium]|nr:hypothetical protein [Gemmatimonadaceae bacterium]